MKLKDAIKIYNTTGGHFFEKETMEFFGSKIESELYNNRCFITSENNFDGSERFYNVRQFSEDFKKIDTVGAFNTMKTRSEAEDLIGGTNMKLHIRMKEESIVDFYDAVAEAMSISKDQIGEGGYSPSKIEVSQERFEVLKGDQDSMSFAMLWLNYGPHAIDDLFGDEVVIYDGFITIKEDEK